MLDDLSPPEKAFLRSMLGITPPGRMQRPRTKLGEIPVQNMELFQLAPFELTRAQTNVLREVLNGKTNKEIGYALNISPRTVEVHRQQALEKLGARNAVELTRVALDAIERRPLGIVAARLAQAQ